MTQNLRVLNILRVFDAASDEDMLEGFAWYNAARSFATGLSERYGVSVRCAAAVIAALSPQNAWGPNMRAAESLLATGHAPTLGNSVRRARHAVELDAAGRDPAEALASKSRPWWGAKVRAFFACIVDPDSDSVCIDRHAYDITEGRVTDDRTRKALSLAGVYDEIAAAYVEAARLRNVKPAEMQAVTWVSWRRTRKSLMVVAA